MTQTVHIGVLALQGSFAEHLLALQSLSNPPICSLVRTAEELELCNALIIPGGESTALSFLARSTGLLEPLRSFVRDARIGKKSVWGSCAGMIWLCTEVMGAVKDYEGLGGFDAKIVRNQFGRQAASFAYPLDLPFLSSTAPFLATFIRAPVLFSIASPEVEVLSRVPLDLLPKGAGPDATAVLACQGGVLISSFHPELGTDRRIHEWWVEEVKLRS